jgi:hypothetical protein
MADTPTSAGFASAIAPLQWRDAPADTVEKECEKEFSAHRPCGHSLDKIRKTANLGPDLMVCGAHSEPARDAETFSAERYHLVVPEAMRLEQLDPFSGPSPSWYDEPNLTEWEQVLARAPDTILAGAHELGSATDRMARGDAPEPFRIEITEITEIGVEITEIDVETNPAAGKRGGTAATLRNHNDDVGKTSEARVIEGHSGADGEKSGPPVPIYVDVVVVKTAQDARRVQTSPPLAVQRPGGTITVGFSNRQREAIVAAAAREPSHGPEKLGRMVRVTSRDHPLTRAAILQVAGSAGAHITMHAARPMKTHQKKFPAFAIVDRDTLDAADVFRNGVLTTPGLISGGVEDTAERDAAEAAAANAASALTIPPPLPFAAVHAPCGPTSLPPAVASAAAPPAATTCAAQPAPGPAAPPRSGPASEALPLGAETPTPRQALLADAIAAAERPDEPMDPTTLKADITALGRVSESAKKKKKKTQAKPGLGHGT